MEKCAVVPYGMNRTFKNENSVERTVMNEPFLSRHGNDEDLEC